METTILENNKLIAEFMGAEYKNFPYKDKDTGELIDCYMWTEPENGYPKDMNITPPSSLSTAFMIENFSYHKSWDWLFPVIDKLQNVTEEPEDLDHLKDLVWWSDIESVYNEVVECIKWYNQQNAECNS